jgi:flavin-dependent dehydrogenase
LAPFSTGVHLSTYSALLAARTINTLLGAGTERITEGVYGEYRVRKDRSYLNTSFWKPGPVLIGDAACFIDPLSR